MKDMKLTDYVHFSPFDPKESAQAEQPDPTQTAQLHKAIETFQKLATKQEEKGIAKYGGPLDPHDLNYDWLDMAIEEQVDGFKYMVAEKKKRAFIANKIQSLVETSVMSLGEKDEVMFWLDKLRGKG